MKFQMQRSEFTKLIGKIQSIVPTKPSIPILANVRMQAENGQVIVSATDLTVSMQVSGIANIVNPGAITLPARRLFQLTRELTTPDVEIEATSADIAVVRSGSSHFRIQGIHESEFPSFPDLNEGYPLHFKAEILKDMLMRTAFAAAKDDSRQVLNGVLMQKVASLATFVGTDGKRLAKNQIEVIEENEQQGTYILPLKAVDEIVKMLDENGEEIKLVLMSEKLAIETADTILISKLLSGQYPEVSRVIPGKSEKGIQLHREELISLLRQVALFTSEGSHSVRFTFSDGMLQLTATSGEVGEGKVSMPVNYSGPKLEIAFNPYYFLDILRHTKDETVRFDVTDSYNPGLITDSSEAEFVIMPMRLD